MAVVPEIPRSLSTVHNFEMLWGRRSDVLERWRKLVARCIVNGRRSVSTFPAIPARWSVEIVESNVDFSVKSPACHAGATPLIAVAAPRALVTPSEGGDDSPAAAGTALHRLSVSDLPGNGPPQRRIGSVQSKNKALDQSCPNRDQTLSSERPADSPLFSGNVPTLKANCWRNKL